MTHQSPPQTNYTLDRVGKSRGMWLRTLTHLLPQEEKILTKKKKHINHKRPQKQLLPPKLIKMTQLAKQINQGIF